MDQGEELVQQARAAAEGQRAGDVSPAALEAMRSEAGELFEALPEPPPYRRAEDPVRARAKALAPRAVSLLSRLYGARKAHPDDERLELLSRAVESHLRALAAMEQGDITGGDNLAREAWELARAATSSGSFFRRNDEGFRKVFDAVSGESRFDPRPEPLLTVQLFCANEGCRQPAAYSVAPRYATHRFTCTHCKNPFTGHFAEVRSAETRSTGRAIHHVLRVVEVGGGESALEFDDTSGGELLVAPRDLVVLLYSGPGGLAAVENLSTGRVLWIVPRSTCFLATAALGEDAPELEAFRDFRDQVLLTHWTGRLAVEGYYRVGPHLARAVNATPALKPPLRRVFQALHRILP